MSQRRSAVLSDANGFRPTPTDGFPSPTSAIQKETETLLRSHVPPSSESQRSNEPKSKPILGKSSHIQFIARHMIQGFPERYTSQDASQPWLLFWTLQSLSILQVELDPGNRQRAIDTVLTWQHPDGGFGGGPGQAAHLLPTYASVSALAIVGRPGLNGGWDQINREKLYAFFMSLKQPDGSFLVSHHGEVDVRGIYCLLVTATLLDILTPELIEGIASFIASCQTYEGGFSSASFSSSPSPTTFSESPPPIPPPVNQFSTPTQRPALGEAHGGYTFCAVAAWTILQPFLNTPQTFPVHSESTSSSGSHAQPPPELNMKSLLRWLVQMQGSAMELGGFRGRTNKLVDGCYSWWVGGTFSLLKALGINPPSSSSPFHEDARVSSHETTHRNDDSAGRDPDLDWDDVDDDLFDREALQRYILYAGQHPDGGLRDKPPKRPDAYHTMYCLSGLSSAQHCVVPSDTRRGRILSAWKSDDNEQFGSLRKEVFANSLSWTEDKSQPKFVGGSSNRVNATHPIFNLTVTHAEAIMAYFYKQSLPPR